MTSTQELQQHTSTFGMVNIADLNIDPQAQRKLSLAWVKAHAPGFDVDLLGYIVVNKRAGAHKLYCVDGFHRVELMRAVGWGDQKIHAEIFTGLTQAEEAGLFLARNDRRTVRKFDKFRIAVTSRDTDAIAITKIVADHGLIISDQLRDGHICAVDALEKLYFGAGVASKREGAAALGKTLAAMVQAWGRQASSVSGNVILGLGLVQLRYNSAIDQQELIKKLAPFPGGAPGLLGKARSIKDLSSRTLHHCIAQIVVELYNRGKRTTNLETWDGFDRAPRAKIKKKTKPVPERAEARE